MQQASDYLLMLLGQKLGFLLLLSLIEVHHISFEADLFVNIQHLFAALNLLFENNSQLVFPLLPEPLHSLK